MGSPFIAVGVALYLVWMRMTDYLKSSPPDSLPSWPLLIIFAPIWKFLNMIGVTQRTEFSSRLDTSRRYLVACSPHGSYALSGLTWIAPEFRMSWLPEYEHHCTFFGAASCLFYLPLVREFVLLLGCREVKRNTLSKLLKDTKYNVALIPGGIYEQISTRSDEERHYVQKKLGFVRLALEMGIDILPMVGFGENQLFTTHAVGSSVRHWLFKNMGLGIPFITGRWGCTLLPHPTEVVHVYGRPISIKAIAKPTDKEVEETYGRYVAEVTRIFDANAKRLLPADVAAKGIKIMRIGVDHDDRK